jgi:NAD(P)-dependent dehydrogenase (short-subunit alcohol dehydrogenase family)
MAKIAVVIGAGPGLGAAVVRRFAREGFTVAAVARSASTLAGLDAKHYTADTTDAASVTAAFAKITSELGAVDVLVYNAGAFQMGSILELSVEDFERCWRANCLGGFLWSREVARGMVERGRGTIILTGATASLRGSAKFACLAVGKFGLRALAQSMARELGDKGVHVAHVVVDGQIESARTKQAGRAANTVLAPDAIAETYWHLHSQDPTAWTLEMDLRPNVEKF